MHSEYVAVTRSDSAFKTGLYSCGVEAILQATKFANQTTERLVEGVHFSVRYEGPRSAELHLLVFFSARGDPSLGAAAVVYRFARISQRKATRTHVRFARRARKHGQHRRYRE